MDSAVTPPKLIVVKGTALQEYFIILSSLSIGRGLSNDFRIVAEGVSRIHARIDRKDDDYYISDLQSTNGTLLNGRRVDSESMLRHGDIIELGKMVRLRFERPIERFRETDVSELINISSELNPAIRSSIAARGDGSEGDFAAEGPPGADVDFLRRSFDRLAMLYEVNSSMSSASSLEETLERIANIVLTLEKADRVAILLCEDGEEKVRPAVFRDKSKTSSQRRIQVSRTIVEKTINEGVGILSADALSDPRFSSAKSIEIQNVKSVICVPLKRKEKIIGAIYVDCLFAPEGFDEDDLRLLLAISNEASIVVENVQLTEQLIEAAKFSALGQFAAGIAHEIKNQLGAITLAELIREKYPDDERLLRYADILIEARDHLVGIVSEVRDFSKNTPQAYEKAPVELVRVVQSALRLVKFDKLFDGIKINSESLAEPLVICDKGKIKQVLINMLQNAAYAVNECQNAEIRLEIDQESEFGLVRVIDNGCGIATEHLEKIWRPLFTTRENSGTGLGLDICKKIIDAHEGRIYCQSPPNGSEVGTAFTIMLPLQK